MSSKKSQKATTFVFPKVSDDVIKQELDLAATAESIRYHEGTDDDSHDHESETKSPIDSKNGEDDDLSSLSDLSDDVSSPPPTQEVFYATEDERKSLFFSNKTSLMKLLMICVITLFAIVLCGALFIGVTYLLVKEK